MDISANELRRRRLRVGMVSTVPPTECGLATFTRALADGIGIHDVEISFIESGRAAAQGSPGVVAALGDGSDAEVATVVSELDRCDVVVIQHEYGIYPGRDGDRVLALAAAVRVPVVVVAHTVLSEPSDHQREILSTLCSRATAVVVMTDAGRRRLRSIYGIEERRLHVIVHGAALPTTGASAQSDRQRMLSWGLLGPGKGIEHALDALASIADHVDVDYVVAGATHPNVLARDGEQYRNSLIARSHRLGIADRVTFDDAYLARDELAELIGSCDVVVLPYDSKDQVTSGVLVDAVAAGRPVVSTAFPHAVELLGCGAGLVVPQGDATALASALSAVLTDGELRERLERAARTVAPTLSWRSVAQQYLALFDSITVDETLAS